MPGFELFSEWHTPLVHQTRLFRQSGRLGAPDTRSRTGRKRGPNHRESSPASTVRAGRFARQDSGVGQVLGGFTRVSRAATVPIGRRQMYQADSLAAPNR